MVTLLICVALAGVLAPMVGRIIDGMRRRRRGDRE
jgi:hypothetical protein